MPSTLAKYSSRSSRAISAKNARLGLSLRNRGVIVRKTGRRVVLAWPAVFDLGGVRHYRVGIGGRTVVVTRPRVTLASAGLRTSVSVAAVDRGGNVGPTTVVPLRRLR